MKPKIKFDNKEQSLFFSELRSRIDSYFKENKLSKNGGKTLIYKAIFMLSLYIIPFILFFIYDFSNLSAALLCFLMGLGISGVGMCVMHDAIHGSFSNKKWVNDFFGGSLYLMGGNVLNWEFQHNKLHHTYTNVHGIDEDITGKPLLRLSFAQKKLLVHKFQHIYASLLYCFMTITFLYKDFKEVFLYKKLAKQGLIKPFNRQQFVVLVLSKILYLFIIAFLPLYFIESLSFGQWLVGFLIMHGTAGIILSFIFQLAHVVEGAHQDQPSEEGSLENAWAVHQLLTTANFAGGNKILSWCIGGLDYQVEHHLFPNISHIHYPALSKIVEDTAKRFQLPYNNKNSFFNALMSHFRMLKLMGKYQTYPV